MQVSNNFITNQKNNINFTSRNPEIRFADDLARLINQSYPRVSDSKIFTFKNVKKFPKLLLKFYNKVSQMRYFLHYNLFGSYFETEHQLNLFTKTIKDTKLGNCAESAILAEIAARANGITDCYQADLYQKRFSITTKDLDHTVLFVKNNGKPYIIDAWLGFADYLPNAINKYNSEFKHCFKSSGKKPKMFFKKAQDVLGSSFDFEEKGLKLDKMFPDLIHYKKP